MKYARISGVVTLKWNYGIGKGGEVPKQVLLWLPVHPSNLDKLVAEDPIEFKDVGIVSWSIPIKIKKWIFGFTVILNIQVRFTGTLTYCKEE